MEPQLGIMEQLGGVGTLAPGAALVLLLILSFRMVMTGAIVPRKTYEDLKEDRDRLRTAQQMDSETLKEIGRQVSALVEASRTTVQVAKAVQKVTLEERP